MNSLYKILTAILLGTIESIKGIAVLFYLDNESNPKSSRLEPGRATKESLSTPTATAGVHQHGTSSTTTTTTTKSTSVNKDNANRKKEFKVLHRVIQCCLLNGGVFMFSIMVFEYGILPGLFYILSYLSTNSDAEANVWNWMMPSLSLLFHSFWVAPLFILSKIVNNFWFQDIADSAFRSRKGRRLKQDPFSEIIADLFISFIVQISFLLQSTIIKYLPIPFPFVCNVVYIVHMSLLCSLYSFEYKWFNIGWKLPTRLTYIETNWPFFLGFGLPLAILSEMPESIVASGCVFSVLFPLFILSANEAKPKVAACETPLKIFSLSVAVSNGIVRMFRLKKPTVPGTIETKANTTTATDGRGITPPLSSGASTPSLNYQLSQQQRIRQHNHQHRQHSRSSPSSVASSASTAGTSMGPAMTPQQQQALYNRSLRR
ncbi:etoposide-induced protein 2.4 homolog [Toxorhynchites rutilus septentrionalis]|uniref:etoposide-induced protein 2.4 homolog n=1 Tax=Toxorhynchites rutilus septentrionalis TaxID=329112 RepID=UPI00247ABE06|nr:etoposide-induced protein 2.4 homolog [Toxorhynchites rutilus septentrionalis]